MKKGIIYIVAVILIVFLFLLFPRDEVQEKTVNARVVETSDRYLMVYLDSGYSNCKAALPDGQDSKQYKVGDIVSITFSGKVLESNPARLDRVSNIELAKKE